MRISIAPDPLHALQALRSDRWLTLLDQCEGFAPNQLGNETVLLVAAQMLDADRIDEAVEVLRRFEDLSLIHDYNCTFAISVIAARKDAPNSGLLAEAALGSPTRLNSALFGFLLRSVERHRWAFAASLDWNAVLIDENVIDEVVLSIWDHDPTAAAQMFIAAIAARPERARRLPPPSLRSFNTISVWQSACRMSKARERLLFCTLLDMLEQVAKSLLVHRPLSPAELHTTEVFLVAAQAEFPELRAWYTTCLARKLNEDGQLEQSLAFYYAVLRDGNPQLAPLDLIFNTASNYVRSALGRPVHQWAHYRTFDPADLRTLILLCIPTMQKVEGILLCECLRMISPGDSTFAAWSCLCLDAPEWSDIGFRRLTYINPATVAGFPKLVDWPARRPPQAAYEHFRQRSADWPRISVVVPSFQQGAFIEQTLQSIIHQGYPNVEIIVEDGGSTDETLEVLDRYRPHIAHLRSSRDNGQSDAITRGFAKASGTLLTWLNSDDMLAPFALFHVAEAMMRGADIVAGACFEFKGPKFIQANLPGTPSGTLRIEDLGDLKNKWFMGHFFYQPEVFFSSELYAKAGAYVDTSLNYTMDYDLWLRFAAQKPRFEKVFWPVALFRRHEEQKTFNLDRTVIEQGRTRRRYAAVADTSDQQLATRRRLRAVLAKPEAKIHVVTGKIGIFFPETMASDLAEAFDGSRYRIGFSQPNIDLVPEDCDLVIHINTLMETERVFMEAIQSHPADPLKLGWFWDNHHAYMANLNFAQRYDMGIAGHDFARDYLANERMWLLPSIPLCFTQWSARTLEAGLNLRLNAVRSNALQGGFVDYSDVPARSLAIRKLVECGLFDELKLIDATAPSGYFSQTTSERLATWCSRKVSLAANVERDIPIRFFDALVLGQIPIIPQQTLDLPWFNECFPDEVYVVCDTLEPPDVERAWHEALIVFDRDGVEGLRARTDRAAARHSFTARLRDLLALLENAAAADARTGL